MLDSEQFVRLYSFRKPTPDDLLIMSSESYLQQLLLIYLNQPLPVYLGTTRG